MLQVLQVFKVFFKCTSRPPFPSAPSRRSPPPTPHPPFFVSIGQNLFFFGSFLWWGAPPQSGIPFHTSHLFSKYAIGHRRLVGKLSNPMIPIRAWLHAHGDITFQRDRNKNKKASPNKHPQIWFTSDIPTWCSQSSGLLLREPIRKLFVVVFIRRAPRTPPIQCWHAARPGS